MKTQIIILFFLMPVLGFSQNPGMKELMEKNIGWEKLMTPKGNVGTSRLIEGRTYSAYQLGLIDLFTDWIKKSYIPIGALPQFEKYAFPKKDEYLPIGTGVFLWAWIPCYDGTKNIVKAQPASAAIAGINANFLPGMEPSAWFNTPTANYFTLPYADFLFEGEQNFISRSNKTKDALKTSFTNYICFPWGGAIVIILTPDNRLPFVPVTRKEVLDLSEAGIKKAFEKKKITEPMYNEEMEALNKWREKYKNSLNEPAMIKENQLRSYSFTPDHDLFSPSSPVENILYTVYKFDPSVIKETSEGKVKWVTITFFNANQESKTSEKELYRAMTKHLNIEYIYNYFFNPAKVKGIPYKPLDAELLNSNSKKFQKANTL